jgi:Rps23 Pro-64 3,4-dihydroxylase Tpa1-like proline 4-hydroxylase
VLVKNISFGVNLYSGSLTAEDCGAVIDTLNRELDGTGVYSWNSFNSEEYPENGVELRNALDFEISSEKLGPLDSGNKKLYEINSLVLSKIKQCIDDYGTSWEIDITHYEPLNFVKYRHPNNYFKLHVDHGPEHFRTVSAVLYLNDDYEGGELVFPRLDNLVIKPKFGDIVVFPSNYPYVHESKNILSGTKYSVAAMTDYTTRDQNG